MTKKEAICVLECMAIDMTGAIADLSKRNPLYDVIEQRLNAINLAQESLRDNISSKV